MNSVSVKVGDTVKFRDEFGNNQTGQVTRMVPKGEYSSYMQAVAIAGTYGYYLRRVDKIAIVAADKARQ